MGRVSLRLPDDLIAEAEELVDNDSRFNNKSAVLRYWLRRGIEKDEGQFEGV
jgi:Arc/MetJ-type ribon-helix-helix transcriptional regulator